MKKKIIALILTLNIVFNLTAQINATLGNNLGLGWYNSLTIHGMDEEKNLYVTAYDHRLKAGVSIYKIDAKLVKISTDLQKLQVFQTPEIGKEEYIATKYLNNQLISIIKSGSKATNAFEIIKVNKGSLKKETNGNIAKTEIGESAGAGLSKMSSPDNSKFAIFTRKMTNFSGTKLGLPFVVVYDDKLTEKHKIDVANSDNEIAKLKVNSYYLCNNGNVLGYFAPSLIEPITGLFVKKEIEPVNNMVLYKTDGTMTQVNLNCPKKIKSSDLKFSKKSNEILFVAYYTEPNEPEKITGIYLCKFDDNGQILSENMMDFSNENFSTMYFPDAQQLIYTSSRKDKKFGLNSLTKVVELEEDEDGTKYLISELFEFVSSTGSGDKYSAAENQNGDKLITKISKDNKIEWVKNIPCSYSFRGHGFINDIFSYIHKGKLHLLYSDIIENAENPNVNSKVKMCKVGRDNCIPTYTFLDLNTGEFTRRPLFNKKDDNLIINYRSNYTEDGKTFYFPANINPIEIISFSKKAGTTHLCKVEFQ